MKIVWSKTADKQFSKIDTRYKSRIKSRLEKMDDKASPISDIKKLSSPENHYRLQSHLHLWGSAGRYLLRRGG